MSTGTQRQQHLFHRGCVLVTGAAGLLGRELTHQFRLDGWETLGVDLVPADTNTLVGDLGQPEIARQACGGVDVVVHAAARQYHSDLPALRRGQFFAYNEHVTRELVTAAREAGVRHFVFVSSDMSYGIPTQIPIREDAPQRPIGPYGRSKLASERICLEAASDDFQVTIFRPRLIIGPGRLGVLRTLFDRIDAHRPIYTIGNGQNRYQMVAVGDVADACVRAVDRRVGGIFNMGSDAPPKVRTLLEDLIQRARSRSVVRALPSWLTRAALGGLDRLRMSPLTPEQYQIAPVDFVLDTTAAREQLGWQPRFNDADMLWSAYRTYTSDGLVSARSASVESIPPLADVPQRKPTQTH